MKIIATFIKNTFPIAVAALLVAFVLTMQLPLEVYINNSSEFLISTRSLTFTLIIAFVAVFLVAFLPATIPYAAFRKRYFAFLAALGILLWFSAHFLFGNYGVLDGRGLTIDTFSAKAIIEVVVAIVLLIAAVIFCKKIHTFLFQAVSLLLIFVVALTGYELIKYQMTKDPHQYAAENTDKLIADEFLTFSNQSNVIHILLDEQQSTLIEIMLERDPDFADKLSGFTFYPNTSANFPLTMMSVPAMLSGKLYQNDIDVNDFTDAVLHNNTFVETLQAANYTPYFHTQRAYCKENRLDNCSTMQPVASNISAVTLLDYSIFRAAPDMLKPKIYRNEEWVISRHFINPNYSASFAGVGYLDFEYFNQHAKVADIPPTYHFFHNMTTHSPIVLDKDCNLRTKRVSRHSLDGRIEQSYCGFNNVFEFLTMLKEADAYDNSFIIISSDHGGRYHIPELQETLKELQIDSKRFSAGLATLMIKPFNAPENSLQVSNTPAALNDIPNTILANLDQPLIPEGKNILTLTKEEPHPRTYISYDSNGNWDLVRLPPISIYSIEGDVRNPADWKLVCTDDDSPPMPSGYDRCNQ